MKRLLQLCFLIIISMSVRAQTCIVMGGPTEGTAVELTAMKVSDSGCVAGTTNMIILDGFFYIAANSLVDLTAYGDVKIFFNNDSMTAIETQIDFRGPGNNVGRLVLAAGASIEIENEVVLCDAGLTGESDKGFFTFVSNGNQIVLEIGPESISRPTLNSLDNNCGINDALPIELISFEAVANGNDTDLTWATATETNNDYFTVEYSLDGINFMAAGEIDGAGISEARIDYSFTHENAFDGIHNTVFYRLKQTDFDGTSSYSKTTAVNFGGELENSIFPNPVVSGSNAIITSTEEIDYVTIYSITGKVLQEIETGGSNVETIGTSNLAKGLYLIRINGGSDVKKLVVN